ncbi:helicase associated domain-containing protein [Streptomyces roseolus]|uniref:helicase associated domain-containing protein n=1 Tax=Streptomyces roseolus TaxID=67358 RepID=UPI0037A10212
MWGDNDGGPLAISQPLANLRRPGTLGKDPALTATRAAQPAATEEDWNCSWPLDWQRHHRVLARLAVDEPDGRLPAIAPGAVHDVDDLGTWITRQRRARPKLSDEQRTRLAALGITSPATETVSPPAPGAAKGKLSASFLRGVKALAQFTAREGTGATPARPHRAPSR